MKCMQQRLSLIHIYRWNATTLHFRNKLVISREEDFFGPGVYDLLKYIDETGSIQAAAAKMNMSYSCLLYTS